MFGWLFKRVSRKRREIFHYWDGVKQRSIDPSDAHFQLFCNSDVPLAARLADAMKEPDGPEPDVSSMTKQQRELYAEDVKTRWREKEEARRECLDLIRQVFDVKAYSDDTPGLTLDETENLFAEFMVFVERLKKKPSTSRSKSRSSDQRSSGSNSPRQNGSASPSTSSTSNTPVPSR